MGPLDVFPLPRQVDRYVASAAVSGDVVEAPAADLPAQGYRLRIGPAELRLDHADDAGRRYGRRLVDQIRRPDGTFPEVEVTDWPDVARRGFMLDVSRGRVPTRETLDWWVDLLDRCRFNHLQLYVEHTFASVGNDDVWGDASPLTADDLGWLDERCQSVGIELAVNQNCFGHMGEWLRHERHRWRAECPDGATLPNGTTMPPSVLAPTPDNAAFALGLVREQLAAVSSRLVHIGCDETFELGRGASSDEAARRGLAAVYADHVERLARPLLDDGCRVLFWADVVARHPEATTALRLDGLVPVVWNYEPPGGPAPELSPRLLAALEPFDFDLGPGRSFDELLDPVADRPAWIAPGTCTWLSLVGRLDDALPNLRDAARVARDRAVEGVLVTDWGDAGHLQPPAVSIPPVVFAGAVLWCEAAAADLDPDALADVIDRHVVDDSTGTFGRTLVDLGRLSHRTGQHARNASPLFGALAPHEFVLRWGTPDVDATRAVVDDLERAATALGSAHPTRLAGTRLVAELRAAIGLAHHGARRLLATAEGRPPAEVAPPSELAAAIAAHRAAWALSSRPGGIERGIASLERTLAAEHGADLAADQRADR